MTNDDNNHAALPVSRQGRPDDEEPRDQGPGPVVGVLGVLPILCMAILLVFLFSTLNGARQEGREEQHFLSRIEESISTLSMARSRIELGAASSDSRAMYRAYSMASGILPHFHERHSTLLGEDQRHVSELHQQGERVTRLVRSIFLLASDLERSGQLTPDAVQELEGRFEDVLADLEVFREDLEIEIQQARLARWEQVELVGLSLLLVTVLLLSLVRALHQLTRRSRQLQTELRESQENTRRARISSSRTVESLARELLTPLKAMTAMAGALSSSQLDEDQRTLAASIAWNGHSASSLIRHYVEFASDSDSSVVLKARELDLEELFRCLDRSMEASLREGVKLDWTIGSGVPPWIRCDDTLLMQILMNLTGLATAELHPHSLRLEVDALETAGEDVQLRFGLTAALMEGSPWGHGEGRVEDLEAMAAITISRRIAQAMGGNIDVALAGHDCVIHLRVWVEMADAPSGIYALRQETGSSLLESDQGLRILVVDDNPVNRKLVSRMLENLGHTVELACDGQEAVDRCTAGTHDLVFMDLQMPGMGGVDACREILAAMDTPPIVMALTANVMPEHREQCREVGMQGFLTKPLRQADLAEAIQSVTRQPG